MKFNSHMLGNRNRCIYIFSWITMTLKKIRPFKIKLDVERSPIRNSSLILLYWMIQANSYSFNFQEANSIRWKETMLKVPGFNFYQIWRHKYGVQGVSQPHNIPIIPVLNEMCYFYQASYMYAVTGRRKPIPFKVRLDISTAHSYLTNYEGPNIRYRVLE